ncbi:MAG TPA: LPS assembly lipoprotein LptE [Alphaproteobacteria bacterium]|nr:LPS assembly lipoprotein LptE [Alphaproteobacteria bacterium]
MLVLALPLLLAACGFQPLYGETQMGVVAAQFAETEVAVIPNRSGQILRNYLIEDLNPSGRPDDPAYVLNVGLNETFRDLAIRKDATATRANLIVSASYRLRNGDGEPLTSGSVQTITSYNILRDEFATLSAERDARDRALRQISEDISTRLALYFNREP